MVISFPAGHLVPRLYAVAGAGGKVTVVTRRCRYIIKISALAMWLFGKKDEAKGQQAVGGVAPAAAKPDKGVCPWSDCSCGAGCKCGAGCSCGSKRK